MKILDCTLRDGGYCNSWNFGEENIKKIICRLAEARIDIIECGFLTEKLKHSPGLSKFNSMDEINSILPARRDRVQFVCMINCGEYDVSNLPERKQGSVDGIRIAFHKKDVLKAVEMGGIVKEKGYELFLQPMLSLSYADEEFLSLVHKSNELEPHAFYIVDSFGVMKQRDLIRLFYLVEHNLNSGSAIGFHSHNNMQLAYSNAQALLGSGSGHELIIDSSVFGMGRGAGNLNTELFVEFLNDYYHTGYELKPLLSIIDEILNRFYQNNRWGYSLPNYLSAKHNTHPDYAGYLESRKTLTMDNMDDIFSMMDHEKRISFDRNYIEKLYVEYLASGEVQNANLSKLENEIMGKTVLVIAPGRSILSAKEKIISAVKSGAVPVSVNFDYAETESGYIFLSNLRRYRELDKSRIFKCIVTSNVPAPDAYVKTGYRELLNSNETVMDNASLMLIKFVIRLGCKNILLAGLDGYDYDTSNNFAVKNMQTELSREWITNTNYGIADVLKQYRKEVPITFLTEPKYVRI